MCSNIEDEKREDPAKARSNAVGRWRQNSQEQGMGFAKSPKKKCNPKFLCWKGVCPEQDKQNGTLNWWMQ